MLKSAKWLNTNVKALLDALITYKSKVDDSFNFKIPTFNKIAAQLNPFKADATKIRRMC